MSSTPSRPTKHTLALVVLVAVMLAACRSAWSAGVPAEAAPSSSQVDVAPAGSSLAVRRPSAGVALLSLWIDAGSRDANPAQVATAAAWWAADQVGAEARVLPDGTELRLLCSHRLEGVAACARRLLSALTVEAPNEAQLSALRDRLRSARRSAANDEARQALTLALAGLLGDVAAGLSPLGRDEQDVSVSAATVGHFIGQNYAASRAILLGLGDLTKSELQGAWPSARRPAAVAARASRTLSPSASELRVALGKSNQIALVVPTASVPEAASLCERFRHIHPQTTANISSLRGATLAHLHLPGGELPFARLQAAVFDVRRLQGEPGDFVASPPPDTLEEMARQMGEQWIARGPAAVGARAALGVGLILAHDEHAVDTGDGVLAKGRGRALAAIEAGTKNSSGATRGESSQERALVTSDNGARIEVLRRRGDGWFSAAIRFAGGSALDSAHGAWKGRGAGYLDGRRLRLQQRALARSTPRQHPGEAQSARRCRGRGRDG